MVMTSRERLETLFDRRAPDRTPMLGGWIACPDHICALAGVTLDDYWDDPVETTIRAHEILGVDGMIDLFVPKNRDDFRFVDAHSYQSASGNMSLDEALDDIAKLPSGDEFEANFDFEGEYAKFKKALTDRQAQCGDIVWMPAQWFAGARVALYGRYGYENYFLIVGGFAEETKRLFEFHAARGYCISKMIARAVTEGIYPHAVLVGEDICTQSGPMVSPDFIENVFGPYLKRGLEPLLEVGCKPVWHSDGDLRRIMDILIECGIQGFQGFQPECGMTLDYVVQKRTRDGEPLIIFGPMAVTVELPKLTPDEVRAKVREYIETARGAACLALFTSNTINPDVPLENVRAMYEAIAEGV